MFVSKDAQPYFPRRDTPDGYKEPEAANDHPRLRQLVT
jgi:hypothetical protein